MSSDLGSADTVVTTAPSPSDVHHSSSPSITSLTTTTDWRPYTFEHPLTAATSAMLNISGASEDPSSGFGILYDYHYGKLGPGPDITKSEKTLSADIWSPVVVTNIGNGSKLSNGDITEVYVPAIHQSTKLTSVLRRSEAKIPKLAHNGHSRYTNGDSISPHHDHHHHHHHHSPAPTSGGVIIVKEESGGHSPGSPRMNGILGVSNPGTPLTPTSVSPNDEHSHYQSPQLFATLSNPAHGSPYDFVGSGNVVVSSPQFTSNLRGPGSTISTVYPVGTSPSEPYYRVDYFANEFGASGVTTASRQLSPYDGASDGGPSFVDRYVRQGGPYKHTHGGLPVDLPSPDSGIGTEAITPRDQSNIQQGFDYTDLCHPGLITDMGASNGRTSPGSGSQTSQQKSTRPWHDFGRQNEADKIQIPKLFSNYGFRYYLESPISTSQRRDDDRITYINKGQFYGITLEYIPDPEKPIKSQTVKTVVMLVFREEKSPEDEIKAWQFWHGRQHSVKQRILDADTKNSVGLVGCIDEIAHNAIAIYWNPMESSAKINVAVQCLSTDFSSQKGVKGLPLHLQIDTYDDPRDPNCPISHRGYGQIKVFCDKGAERKTRDEERRAAKRKLTATGKRKLDDMYHTSCERSEFYAMSDLSKPPVLFTPAEDIDKLTSLELHGFYSTNSEGSDQSGVPPNSDVTNSDRMTLMSGGGGGNDSPPRSCASGGSPGQLHSGSNSLQPLHPHHHHQQQQPTILKFHHTFPPDSPPSYIRHTSNLSTSISPPPSQPPPSTHQPVSVISNEKTKEQQVPGLESNNSSNGVSSNESVIFGTSPTSSIKRMRLLPPPAERLMLYVRQDTEEAFTPLHLVPPTRDGLLRALEEKYKISMGSVNNLYRRNSKGIVAKIDDEMLKHYCHEDSFLLDVLPLENDDAYDVTLSELLDCAS